MIAMGSISLRSINDGAPGVGISTRVVEYCYGTSSTTPPSGTWTTTIPSAEEGKFLWTRITITYTDGQTSVAYSISKNGIGIAAEKRQYYLSTSPLNLTGGEWSYEAPYPIPIDKYLWGRLEFTMTDGSTQYSTAIYENTISGIINKTNALENNITMKVWSEDIQSAITDYDTLESNTSLKSAFAELVIDVNGLHSTVGDTVSSNSSILSRLSVAEQTAGKISWLVQSGTSSANMQLTSDALDVIAEGINLTGKVNFSAFDSTSSTKLGVLDNLNVLDYSVTYGYTSSPSTQPATWQTSVPAWADGRYIWQKTVVSYKDGTFVTDIVCLTGQKGETGTGGLPATAYSLIVSHAGIVKTKNGTYNPSAITLDAKSQTGSSSIVPYSGRFKIETKASTSASWTGVYTSAVDQITYEYAIPANIIAVRCTLYSGGAAVTNESVVLDQQTVPIVTDGLDGQDAYTVILTNESHTFVENTASSTDIYVIAYKGSNQIAATIGTITTPPSGMSTRIADNNSTSAKVTVSVTSSFETANGTLSIPITVDGKTFTKEFTYTLAIKGEPGGSGTNNATVFLYQRAASTPSKPSSTLTYTFSNGKLIPASSLGNWTQSIPSGSNPCYVIIATASSIDGSDTIPPSEWSTPVLFVENGYNQATVFLYRRAATQPNIPADIVTYTFSTGALSAVPAGWSRSVPSTDGNPCWMTTASVISQNESATIASSAWTTPTKIVTDGANGVGITSTVTTYAIGASGTVEPGETLVDQNGNVLTDENGNELTNGGWSTTIPSAPAGYYLWTKVEITYSDGTTNTSYSVSRSGRGIQSITKYYYLGTEAPTVTPIESYAIWSIEPQPYVVGQKYYICNVTVYDDGSTECDAIVEDRGVNSANARAQLAYNAAGKASDILAIWTEDALLEDTTIDGGFIKTHTIDTHRLAADAIMSHNFGRTAGNHFSTEGSYLDLATGNFYTPVFSVIRVSPTDENLETGTFIGNWSVSSTNGFTNGDGSVFLSSIGLSNIVIPDNRKEGKTTTIDNVLAKFGDVSITGATINASGVNSNTASSNEYRINREVLASETAGMSAVDTLNYELTALGMHGDLSVVSNVTKLGSSYTGWSFDVAATSTDLLLEVDNDKTIRIKKGNSIYDLLSMCSESEHFSFDQYGTFKIWGHNNTHIAFTSPTAPFSNYYDGPNDIYVQDAVDSTRSFSLLKDVLRRHTVPAGVQWRDIISDRFYIAIIFHPNSSNSTGMYLFRGGSTRVQAIKQGSNLTVTSTETYFAWSDSSTNNPTCYLYY